MDNDQQILPPIKIVVAKNDKELITPRIKCLISHRQKSHHTGRQAVRDQLAKNIKMEKKAKHKFNELKVKLSQTLMQRNLPTYIYNYKQW